MGIKYVNCPNGSKEHYVFYSKPSTKLCFCKMLIIRCFFSLPKFSVLLLSIIILQLWSCLWCRKMELMISKKLQKLKKDNSELEFSLFDLQVFPFISFKLHSSTCHFFGFILGVANDFRWLAGIKMPCLAPLNYICWVFNFPPLYFLSAFK